MYLPMAYQHYQIQMSELMTNSAFACYLLFNFVSQWPEFWFCCENCQCFNLHMLYKSKPETHLHVVVNVLFMSVSIIMNIYLCLVINHQWLSLQTYSSQTMTRKQRNMLNPVLKKLCIKRIIRRLGQISVDSPYASHINIIMKSCRKITGNDIITFTIFGAISTIM